MRPLPFAMLTAAEAKQAVLDDMRKLCFLLALSEVLPTKSRKHVLIRIGGRCYG